MWGLLKLAATRYPLPNTHLPNTKISDYPKYQTSRLLNPPTHSGVERVGENENANYPIPTTKYQYQLPDTQYPNTLMPNTENIKMPKYLMIQNIKIPGCGRGPVALADGSKPWPSAQAIAMIPEPWPRHKPNRQRPKANGHMLEAMAQDIRYPGVRVGEAGGPRTAWQGGIEGRKIYAYHYHYHTIPFWD